MTYAGLPPEDQGKRGRGTWKRPPSPLSPRNAELAALYQSGLTLEEAGARFGIKRQRVEQILKKAGVARRPANSPDYLRRQKRIRIEAQIAKLRAELDGLA